MHRNQRPDKQDSAECGYFPPVPACYEPPEQIEHEPGNNQFSGDYRGRDEVFAHFAGSVAFGLPEFDIHDVVANDDHAVALVTVTVTKTDGGETLEAKFVHVFHVSSGDEPRVLESWTMYEDQAAVDAFQGQA